MCNVSKTTIRLRKNTRKNVVVAFSCRQNCFAVFYRIRSRLIKNIKKKYGRGDEADGCHRRDWRRIYLRRIIPFAKRLSFFMTGKMYDWFINHMPLVRITKNQSNLNGCLKRKLPRAIRTAWLHNKNEPRVALIDERAKEENLRMQILLHKNGGRGGVILR